jgi:hypothetical protein
MRIDLQRGQALAEMTAVLVLLLGLGAAVALIGEWQWRALAAAHASRTHAFLYARGSRAVVSLVGQGSHSVQLKRGKRAADFDGPGGAAAASLRKDWKLEDGGMVTASARFVATRRPPGVDTHTLRRHTSLLADAGHAVGDGQAQIFIGRSDTAWGRAAKSSIRTGRQVAAALQGIDSGWRRDLPVFDWLMPWADLAPDGRVHRAGAGPRRRP